MLRKFASLACVALMSVAFVGCGETATSMGDKAKENVDSAADATKDAAADVVPEGAKAHVDGAIDGGAEGTKTAIDTASEAAK